MNKINFVSAPAGGFYHFSFDCEVDSNYYVYKFVHSLFFFLRLIEIHEALDHIRIWLAWMDLQLVQPRF